MSISKVCRTTGLQACHCCEDLDCGDNISEYAVRFQNLVLAVKAIWCIAIAYPGMYEMDKIAEMAQKALEEAKP